MEGTVLFDAAARQELAKTKGIVVADEALRPLVRNHGFGPKETHYRVVFGFVEPGQSTVMLTYNEFVVSDNALDPTYVEDTRAVVVDRLERARGEQQEWYSAIDLRVSDGEPKEVAAHTHVRAYFPSCPACQEGE